jgi:hypothetical protein
MSADDGVRAWRTAIEAGQRLGPHWTVGSPMLTGTDLGTTYLMPGFSVHDELALLVEAGLPPLRALACATYEPAR